MKVWIIVNLLIGNAVVHFGYRYTNNNTSIHHLALKCRPCTTRCTYRLSFRLATNKISKIIKKHILERFVKAQFPDLWEEFNKRQVRITHVRVKNYYYNNGIFLLESWQIANRSHMVSADDADHGGVSKWCRHGSYSSKRFVQRSFRFSWRGQLSTTRVHAVLSLSVPGCRRITSVQQQLHAPDEVERQRCSRTIRCWFGRPDVIGPRVSPVRRWHGRFWRLLALDSVLYEGRHVLPATASTIPADVVRHRTCQLWGHVGRIQLLGPHTCRLCRAPAMPRVPAPQWYQRFVIFC